MSQRALRIAFPVISEHPEEEYRNYFAATLGQAVAVEEDCDPAEFDGLLLPGGVDMDPACYGRENVACGRLDPPLDALQMKVLDAFVRARKPVLGICRGHEVINVYFGGTLIQHIPTADRHTQKDGKDPAHGSVAEPGSILASLYGERFCVNSSHHQAVERPGKGLRVTQHSDDGVVEAMEHESLPIFTVQWHPERMCLAHRRDDTVDGARVFDVFLEMCRDRRPRGDSEAREQRALGSE